MRKTILRLKIFHLSIRTLTLLLATLLITIGTQLASHADTSQLLLSEDALKDPGSLAVKLQDTRAVVSNKAIETFKEKYGLSMSIWMGKNMQIQVFSDNARSKSQARLTTFLLDRELIVKDIVIDFDPDILSQKVKQSIESKD